MEIAQILHSVSRKAGGLFYSVRSLSKALSLEDVSLKVFSIKDADTETDIQEWTPLRVKAHNYIGPASFGYAPKMLKSLKDFSPDLMHSHGIWTYSSLLELRYARMTDKPYIISPRGMLDPWALNNSFIKKKLAKALFENAHLENARCLHALCQSEMQSMRAYGLNNPIALIPNGVEIPIEKSNTVPPWPKIIGREKKICLFLGRLHPKKGLSALLDAWASVAVSKSKDWVLVIAGWSQNDHEYALTKQVQKLGLIEKVFFVGPLYGDAKDSAFRNANAFILPSLSEGLPMSILEAWSYGLPVIMTPECNIPEGFEDHAAVRVDAKAEGVATGLNTLFDMSKEDRLAMGESGRLLVKKKFLWSKIASKMKLVYNWILGGGDPPDSVFLN